MKYPLFICVAFALLLSSSSCLSSQKDTQKRSTSSKEYLVQFVEGISRYRIESTLRQHSISRYSYLTSSQERGYVVLIRTEDNADTIISSLKQEKSIKNVARNYERSIDQE